MKKTLPIVLIIIGVHLTGCSQKSKTTESAPITTTNNNTTLTNPPQAAQPVPAATNAVPQTSPPRATKKKFEEMTALEVAQDPAAYGFEKGGSMETTLTQAGIDAGMKPSRDEQWTKQATNGQLYILTIHYEDDKIVYAKWGGFNP